MDKPDTDMNRVFTELGGVTLGAMPKPAKAKRHYRLAELIAACNLNVPESAELAVWNALPPVGCDVWSAVTTSEKEPFDAALWPVRR